MKLKKIVYYKNSNYEEKLKMTVYNKIIRNIKLDYEKYKIKTEDLELIQLYYKQNINFKQSSLEVSCSYCKEVFEKSLYDYSENLVNSKFCFNNVCCSSKDCVRENKRYVIQQQTLQGKTSAQGHEVTEAQKIKRKKTLETSEPWKAFSISRIGKTYEEVFGEEVAKEAKRKIREARAIQPEPNLGNHYSDEVKADMSEKKKHFLKNNPDFSREQGNRISESYWNQSEEYRVNRRLFNSLSMEKAFRERNTNWGFHRAWWQNDTDKNQIYQSLYELTYYKFLDEMKIRYKKNNRIFIPYISPRDNEKHWYNPDIVIFDDNWVLTEIHEVKPYEYAYNPKNKDTEYYKITKAKLTVLKEYCILNGLQHKVLTEKEIFK